MMHTKSKAVKRARLPGKAAPGTPARQRELRALRKKRKAQQVELERRKENITLTVLIRARRKIKTALAAGTVGAAFWELCNAFGYLHGAHGAAHDGLVQLFESLRPYMGTAPKAEDATEERYPFVCPARTVARAGGRS